MLFIETSLYWLIWKRKPFVGLEGLVSNSKSGLWLPLGFLPTAKGNYKVLTYWRHSRGAKNLPSLGKNDNDLDPITDGEHKLYIKRLYIFSLDDSIVRESKLQKTHGGSTLESIQSLNWWFGYLSNKMTWYVANIISI